MRINFDFGDLEAFLAVKTTGSFHLAAEKLNLSQSAITRRVQKLELVLDSPLFERTTRAVVPTLAAKRLQARAEAILEDAEEAARAMRDDSVSFEFQRNMIVTVAIVPSAVAGIIPRAFRHFHAAGHSARLRLLDGPANDVAEAVAQGEADFGVCSIPSLEPSTLFEHLFDDQIVLALRPDHPLAGQEILRWSDIAGAPLIVPSRGTGNRLLIDEAMGQARLTLNWTFEVGRSTTALELVASGSGVALLPRSAANSGPARSIVMRPMTQPEIARPVGLISRIGQTDSQAVTALKRAIRQAAEDRT